jgi:hypothetical protein
MYFALFLGEYYARFDIEEAPLTRVLFESEKDRLAAVEGKIIFDLERYLLPLSESKSVVAIPHEKIKSIEAPPLPKEEKPAPAVTLPTPAVASPTAAVASPTPAGTPHTRTETPHVLPSPVASPTATAAPQKK